jgi:hypothetical protein
MKEWNMKLRINIILACAFAILLSAGITAAQVGPDGNLAYTLSNYQTGNAAQNNPDTFIIRNRLDSGCLWTISADALIMTRVGGKSKTLLENNTGTDLLNSNNFDFPWITGPRVGIVGEDVLFGCDVEASFFDLEFDADKNIDMPDGFGFFRIFNQPQLFFGSVLNYRYISQLRNAEINVRHPCGERLSLLMGFRYMELHEDLRFMADNESSFLEANVDNHLYGGQIGLNVALINTCRFSLEGVIKAGVFGTRADLDMTTPLITPASAPANSARHTSFLGEVGLMGIVQITNNLALRGGYQAMWLDGVAIAGDQIENADPSTHRPYVGSTLFYHGAIAGLECAF